jgi:hypothetical protein
VVHPATVNAGDVLYLAASVQTPSGVGSITTPGGWTLLGSVVANSGAGTPLVALYRKVAAGTEDGTNLSVAYSSTTPNFAAQILCFPGVDNTTPEDVATTTADNAVATTCSIPGQTIVTTGAAQLVVSAINSVSGTAAPPTGFTETGDTTSFRAMEVSYVLGLSPGATGARVVDWTPTSARTVGVMAALRPAGVSGATDWGVYRITAGPTLTPVAFTPL